MPRTMAGRAEFLERRIREKGPYYFKLLMSPDLRLELEANRGDKSLIDYVVGIVADHCAYLYDEARQDQLNLFDHLEHFERAYLYEQRLKVTGKTQMKLRIEPELRIDVEIHRDDRSLTEFIRTALAKHCAYYGDPELQNQMNLAEYLNLAAEKDRQPESGNE